MLVVVFIAISIACLKVSRGPALGIGGVCGLQGSGTSLPGAVVFPIGISTMGCSTLAHTFNRSLISIFMH